MSDRPPLDPRRAGSHAEAEGPPSPTSASVSARPSSRLRAALLVGSVFVLGGLAGGMVGRALTLRELAAPFKGPPAEVRARFRLEAMRRHLSLSPEQAHTIEAILREADPARDAAMAACLPELERLREKTDASIREVLTPEQRTRFDEHERRVREHGPRHGPPFGPPGRPPPPRPP